MIREWLESAVGDVIEASSGTELRVCCPFCTARIEKPDTKYHMYVNISKPVAYCFRCNWQGSYISLIISVSGCSYAEALKQLESPLPNVKRFETLFSPMGMMIQDYAMSSKPNGFKYFVGLSEASSKEELAVWNYLVNRRNIPQAVVTKRMGWAPGTNRAWILVDDGFWQGRLIIPGEPKYISAPWPKGDALWNAGALQYHKHLIICEGVFSSIAVGSQAIALCGKSITELQAKRIIQARPYSITIMLDADATQFAYDMAKTFEELGYVGVLKIHKLEAGDPTDGVDGIVVSYDWANVVRNRVLSTV